MGHFLGVVDIGGNPSIVLPVVVAEHVFILLIPGSQNYQLYVVRADLVHHALDQVKALLIRQTRHDSNHKFLIILFQSQLLLKGSLILYFFLAEGSRTVVLNNQRIRLRVEIAVVDSVDNSPQAACSGPHQTIQSLSIERCLNLLGVGTAHRSNGVSIHKPAL